VSAPLVSYKPNARVSETVSGFSPSQTNWGLGVNYETTLRNVSDSTSP
jgi:hypothetical protein